MSTQPPMPTQPSSKRRWSSLTNFALLFGVASVTLFAVGLVIVLFSWVGSLPDSTAARVTGEGPQKPYRPAVPEPAPAAPAQLPAQAPARKSAGVVVAALPTPAATVAAPEPLVRQRNPDAEKNRALGQALSRVGDDPEAQRRLGIPTP